MTPQPPQLFSAPQIHQFISIFGPLNFKVNLHCHLFWCSSPSLRPPHLSYPPWPCQSPPKPSPLLILIMALSSTQMVLFATFPAYALSLPNRMQTPLGLALGVPLVDCLVEHGLLSYYISLYQKKNKGSWEERCNQVKYAKPLARVHRSERAGGVQNWKSPLFPGLLLCLLSSDRRIM